MKSYVFDCSHPWGCHDRNFDNNVINALEKMIADAGIADDGKVENITQDDHMYTATIFEILRPPKPAWNSWSRRRTFPSPAKQKSNLVYMAQRRIINLFSRREGSLHSMNCMRQIKLPLAVQAMHDMLEGSVILSVSAIESF